MSYTQQNFKNGDVLNAEELNKIENAILELEDATSTLEKRTISVKLTRNGVQYKNPGAMEWVSGEGNFDFLTGTSFKATSRLPEGANLNTYTTFGNYIGSNDTTSTGESDKRVTSISNRPVDNDNAFYLQVIQMMISTSYIVQIYTTTSLGDVYYRYKNGNNDWKKWTEITNVYHHIEEVTTRDLNQFVSEKKWKCSDSTTIGNIKNKPIDIIYPFELEVSRTKEGTINQKYYIPSKGVTYNRSSTKVSDWGQWEKTSLNGDILSYNAGSSTTGNPWRVTRLGDLIVHSGSFYTKKDLGITSNNIMSSPENSPKVYSTPEKVIPLQMPIEGSRAVVFGSVGEGKGYIGSTLIKNKVNLHFQAHSPLNDLAYNDSSNFNNIYKIGVIGQRATPPNYSGGSSFTTSSSIKAQIKEIVQTYFDARENGAKFKWGNNWFSNYYSYTTDNGGPVIDDEGYRLLQCDAFVGLILMGQRYNDVYSNMGNGSTRNFATFFSNNLTDDTRKWAFCNRKNETVDGKHNPIYENMISCTSYNNFKICYSGLQAWFFWNQQRVFSTNDFNNLATGDIVFIRKKSDSAKTLFDNITHVGMLTVNDGTVYINQIGIKMNDNGELGGDCALSRIPLRKYLNLPIHAPDTEFYFARPPYNERQNKDNVTV